MGALEEEGDVIAGETRPVRRTGREVGVGGEITYCHKIISVAYVF